MALYHCGSTAQRARPGGYVHAHMMAYAVESDDPEDARRQAERLALAIFPPESGFRNHVTSLAMPEYVLDPETFRPESIPEE